MERRRFQVATLISELSIGYPQHMRNQRGDSHAQDTGASSTSVVQIICELEQQGGRATVDAVKKAIGGCDSDMRPVAVQERLNKLASDYSEGK